MTSARDGWPALFTAAFRQSSNAMALVDERRRHVDVNGAYLNLWATSARRSSGDRSTLSTSRWGGRFRRKVSTDAAPHRLSDRKLEIVALVALGQSGPEIAAELRIAHETVRTHVRNAMVKAGARSRAHLVAKTLAEGAIAP